MSKKENPEFSLRDVTVSALGLAVALPWTEVIKGGWTRELVLFAIKVTIIVAIIAIILNHFHIFARSVKDSMEDHPLKLFEAFGTIW